MTLRSFIKILFIGLFPIKRDPKIQKIRMIFTVAETKRIHAIALAYQACLIDEQQALNLVYLGQQG